MAKQNKQTAPVDFMSALMSTAPVTSKRKKAKKIDMSMLGSMAAPMPVDVTPSVEITEAELETTLKSATEPMAEPRSDISPGSITPLVNENKPKVQPSLGGTANVPVPEEPGPSSFAPPLNTKAEVYPIESVGSGDGYAQPIPQVIPATQPTQAASSPLFPGAGNAWAELFRSPDSDKPLRVAAYIRVSTESDEQEDSYETQHDYFMRVLSENPLWTSAGIYSDYGISGTSRERRRGFNRLMRHCEEGRIDRIITKSISRFSRNTADFLKALEILKANHITIAFEKEHLDTAIGQNDLMVTAFGALAQEEARSIAANIRVGLDHRMPKGEVRNVIVYGYRYSGEIETLPSGYKRRSIEAVPEEAEVVRRIFKEFADGKAYREIARGLNYDHIPTPETRVVRYRAQMEQTPVGTLNLGIDEGWTSRHVKQILILERYCGDVLMQKTFTPDYKTHKSVKNTGELPQYYVQDNHPAIISRELFNEVQAIQEMNRNGKAYPEIRYPFSSRIVCSQCGRFYRTANRNSRPVWFCPTARNNNGKSVCHAEKLYEEQLVRMCRRAVTERFEVIRRDVQKEEESAFDGNITVDWGFTAEGSGLVKTLLHRMEHIHEADDMEHDLVFLNQRIAQAKDEVEDWTRNFENLTAAKDAAVVRREMLGEDDPALPMLESQVQAAADRLKETRENIETLTEKKKTLEAYWNDLEADYEWRRKAIAWMKELPEGKEGTAAFLNGLTNEYLKAFILYIEVEDPLHYKIRWFDDSWSYVRMYSNVD